MNKDEMIKDMAKVITDLYDCDRQIRVDVECLTCGEYCEECEYYEKNKKGFLDCVGYAVGEALYNAGYRKVADDEVVITEKQYKQLKKYNLDRKRLRNKWQKAEQELNALKAKIENGTLIEMPRIVRRVDMSCGYEEYLVQWEKDNGKIKSRIYNNERSAKAKLRELKGE